MKKFGKFIFGTLAVASVAAGAYYLYKTYIKKDSSDDFEDFEDDFEDFEDDEEEAENESREYVSINITSEEDSSDTEELAPEEEKGAEDEQ
jgi:hypothetical protein